MSPYGNYIPGPFWRAAFLAVLVVGALVEKEKW